MAGCARSSAGTAAVQPERWRRLREIYDQVCDVPPVDRDAALVAACGGTSEASSSPSEKPAGWLETLGDGEGELHHRAQTLMSTMRRMMRKPIPMRTTPAESSTIPSGIPATSGGLMNIGVMNVGLITDRSPNSATGSRPTT